MYVFDKILMHGKLKQPQRTFFVLFKDEFGNFY